MAENLEPNNKVNNEISENSNKSNSEEIKESKTEEVYNTDKNDDNSQSNANSVPKDVIKNEEDAPAKNIPKPKKELPLEKKPFQEFINIHLIPALKEEINQ